MSFQILNNDGEALTINQLDKEAAEFWSKELHPKQYATPPVKLPESASAVDKIRAEMMGGNWFDVIGYQIHSPEDPYYTSGWKNVKCSLWTMQVKGLYDKAGEELQIHIDVIHEWLKPYYDLIDHWESKGYQPKQIKE